MSTARVAQAASAIGQDLDHTPSSYLRVKGDVLKRVEAVSSSMPVGLLACQRDPLLKELRTVIHSAKTAPAKAAPAKKKGKDKPPESSASGQGDDDVAEEWHVLLKDTVIFPEGGGQPSDMGVLTVGEGADQLALPVTSAVRRNLDAVHIVEVRGKRAKELAPKLLSAGKPVLVLLDAAGALRRQDHMQQHTGQHLLSALFDGVNLPTLSWALTAWPQPCYVELPGLPKDELVLQRIQQRANALIMSSTPISVEVESMAETQTEASKLPQDYAAGAESESVNTEGVMRTVTIEGIDTNPCCGTHLPSLAHLEHLHIYKETSKVRGTNVRLYFDVGRRAMHNLYEGFDSMSSTAKTLDCARGDVAGRAELLVEKEKALRKREARLKEEVALTMAERIFEALRSDNEGSSSPFSKRRAELDGAYTLHADRTEKEGHSICAIALHRDDADLDLLTAISRELASVYGASSESASLPHLLLCLSSGTTAPAAPLVSHAQTESLLLVGLSAPQAGGASAVPAPEAGKKAKPVAAYTDQFVAAAGDELRKLFGSRLKGGGKGKWQGKLAPPEGASPDAALRWEKDDAGKRIQALKNALGL